MTQKFDTNWNIEDYRTKFECEEHWGLKRDFMLKYKDTFPEERLACLSQVFVNIELMRCRYPRDVMRQVEELAKDVSSKYRKSRKNLLQRTFVKASDAANAKVKGQNRPQTQNKSEIKNSRANYIGFNQASTHTESKAAKIKPVVGYIGFNQDVTDAESKPDKLKPEVNYLGFNKSSTDAESKPDALKPGINYLGFNKSSDVDQKTKKKKIEPIVFNVDSTEIYGRSNKQGQSVKFSGFDQSSTSAVQPSSVEKNVSQFVKSQKRNILDRLGPMKNDVSSSEPSMKKMKTKMQARNEFDEQQMTRGRNQPLSDVIIILHAYSPPGILKVWQVLQASINVSKKILKVDDVILPSGETKCILSVNNTTIGQGKGEEFKDAKFNAAKKGLQFLSKHCYTLKILKAQSSTTAMVGLDEIDDAPRNSNMPETEDKDRKSEDKPSRNKSNDQSISDDNIGSKLLRLMGWTGGGLGKEGEGIVEPVKAVEVVKRRGLGADVVDMKGLGIQGGDVSMLFKRNVRNELSNYYTSDRDDDLIFSEELSNPQRAAIHEMVRREFRVSLQSKSHGKKGGGNRRLAISRKFADKSGLVQHLLQNGGKTDKYEVYLPGTKDIVQECMNQSFCAEGEMS